jgi:hypothetical protein
MNFYQAAVDDQLRHADDQPTIGLILCKDRNEVIVEYALRDMNKPMGVAQYRLTHGSELPKNLQAELPTMAELSKEFPLFSLVKMRMDIERALIEVAAANGIATDRAGIRPLADALTKAGLIPPAAMAVLMSAVTVMNKAVHVVEVEASELQEAIQKGKAFLQLLRR